MAVGRLLGRVEPTTTNHIQKRCPHFMKNAELQVTREETNQLKGMVAVVTGSSSGIGSAIALELAAAQADVIVHANSSRAAGNAIVESIRQQGVDSELMLADISNAAAARDLVDACWNWKDRVDIWVNNAGADVLTGEHSELGFDEKLSLLWNVDVLGTVRLSRWVGARMEKGVILNVGWDQAEIGMEGDSGEMFATVKGAVMAFTRSLARSLAPRVRVNCLAPGWIKTSWGDQTSDYWDQRARQESLLQRWGAPEDVARAARFLASPAASFITGEIIAINGGFAGSARGPSKHE